MGPDVWFKRWGDTVGQPCRLVDCWCKRVGDGVGKSALVSSDVMRSLNW